MYFLLDFFSVWTKNRFPTNVACSVKESQESEVCTVCHSHPDSSFRLRSSGGRTIYFCTTIMDATACDAPIVGTTSTIANSVSYCNILYICSQLICIILLLCHIKHIEIIESIINTNTNYIIGLHNFNKQHKLHYTYIQYEMFLVLFLILHEYNFYSKL